MGIMLAVVHVNHVLLTARNAPVLLNALNVKMALIIIMDPVIHVM